MKKGDKVKTIYGKIETIVKINECQVVTIESQKRGDWFHPTKVFKIR